MAVIQESNIGEGATDISIVDNNPTIENTDTTPTIDDKLNGKDINATNDTEIEIVDSEDDSTETDSEYDISIVDSGPDITEDKIYKGVDVEDYKDYLGSAIFMPTGGVEEMNRKRAEMQSGWEQAGNMLGQAALGEIVGGTIEGLGYILEIGNVLDYVTGEEVEWGNIVTEAGKGLREYGQDNMAIYQEKPGKFDMSDSGWWFSNGVSVASSLSMLIPSMAATKALGFLGKGASKMAGKLSRSLDVAERMGKQATWMTEGISQAIVSRHIENSMEASGTFEGALKDYMGRVNKKTGLPYSEEEARKLAGTAASENYNKGWAMLLQDIPQYLALGKVFNPMSGKMENALAKAAQKGKKAGLKPWQAKTKAAAFTFASEGFEESYQYYIAERGKALTDLNAGLISKDKYNEIMNDAIGSDEMMTSAFFGGLGGNLFQFAGKGATELGKGKEKRAFEKNYEKTYKATLNDRAKSFMALQIKLAEADQNDSPEQRQAVIDEMMLNMTVDALNRGKFEQHIEALQGTAKMTKEEKAKYSKENEEFNLDLAGQYVPAAIEMAHAVRAKYLKYSNKYDPAIAAAMSRNDYDTDRIKDHNSKLSKKRENAIQSIPNQHQLSSTQKVRAEGLLEIISLNKVKQEYNQLLKKTTDRRKPHVEQLIKDTEAKIKEVSSRVDGTKKDDNRSPEQKRKDARLTVGYDNVQEDLIETMAMEEFNNGRMYLNNQENKSIKSKEYRDSFKKDQLKESIKESVDQAETVEDLKDIKEAINEDKTLSDKEKAAELRTVDDRSDDISGEEAAKTDAGKTAEMSAEQLDEITKANKETRTITKRNKAKIKDNIEDEYSEEENTSIQSAVNSEKTLNKNADAKESVTLKLLNWSNTAGKDWFNWLFNGKDKTGKKDNKPVQLDLVVGTPAGQAAEASKKAIALFNKGLSGSKINDAEREIVYNYLPIRAQLSEDIWASIPVKSAKNSFFKTNEYPKRKKIIRAMLLGKGTAKTTITHQFGGNLNVQENDDNTVPTNNILDLKPISGDWGKVDLIVSNEYGELVKASNKDPHPDFEGFQITVKGVQSDDGIPVGYAGGVFLGVPQANGNPFPLKLNLRRPTTQEASFVADLLIGVITKDKGLGSKSRLSDHPELFKRFKEEHPAEFTVVGKDAKVSEVARLFVHMTSDTKGKATHLFLSGKFIQYGTDVKAVVTPENVKDNREALIGFIENNKRRQLNLNDWNGKNSQKYREMMVNGVMTTDAVVGPESNLFNDNKTFGLNNGLKKFSSDVRIAIPGVAPEVTAPIEKKEVFTKESSKLLRSIKSREAQSKNKGAFIEGDGKWVGVYFRPDKTREAVYGKSEAVVNAGVAKKYEIERLSIVAEPVKPVIQAVKVEVKKPDTVSPTSVPIRSRPKTADEGSMVLTGKEAEAAEMKVEKIIKDGIDKKQTLEEIEDRILPRFGWGLNEVEIVRRFIKGKVNGSIKEDFATWRKPTQQPTDFDSKMLDAELDYLEKTFGKEMAEVYFQGIELLPKKNQEELKKITDKIRNTAQKPSEGRSFDSLGEEFELAGNEIYYKDTEEGEGGLYMEYDTAQEAAKAFKALSKPTQQTSEVESKKAWIEERLKRSLGYLYDTDINKKDAVDVEAVYEDYAGNEMYLSDLDTFNSETNKTGYTFEKAEAWFKAKYNAEISALEPALEDLESLTDERNQAVENIQGIAFTKGSKTIVSHDHPKPIRGVRIKSSEIEQDVIDQIDAIFDPLMERALGISEDVKLYEVKRDLNTSYLLNVEKELNLKTKKSSFKNSKVKNQVFHISKNKIKSFDNNKLGSNTGASDTVLGFFFSENYETIASIRESKTDLIEGQDVLGHNVHKVSLNLENPYVLHSFIDSLPAYLGINEDTEPTRNDYKLARERLIEMGHDGVVYGLGHDGVDVDYGFVVFNSKNTKIEEIVSDEKSVLKNRPNDFGKQTIVTYDKRELGISDSDKKVVSSELKESQNKMAQYELELEEEFEVNTTEEVEDIVKTDKDKITKQDIKDPEGFIEEEEQGDYDCLI